MRSKTLLAFTLALFLSFISLYSQEYIQIRVYHFDNTDQLEKTEDFLQSTYLPTLKSEGYERIGVFKNHQEEGDTTLTLYLVLPVESATALYDTDANNMEIFPNEKHYASVENIFLRSFEDMPILKPSPLDSPRDKRIYELRSYESATDKLYKNKVDMFNAGGEVVLFEELGFNAVFYGEVIAGSNMPNLMYMTTHADKETRDKNWKNFVDAPKWKSLSSMPKYQGNVSHIDIFFIYPTEYSDY